jgi:hypothetical protein
MNQVRTVKQVIKDILFEGGYDTDKYPTMGQYALNAIREIFMYHANRHKISKVTVDTQTNTIDWPDDCIDMVYFGIPINGQVWTFTKKGKLITTTTLVNGQETLDSVAGEGAQPVDASTIGYGASGGKNTYYFNNDEDNRRTFISGVNPANVMLAYISNGVEDIDTLIPTKYKEMIKYYSRWKDYERDDNFNEKKAQYFKDLYEQECNKLKAFQAPTVDEIYDALLGMRTATYER